MIKEKLYKSAFIFIWAFASILGTAHSAFAQDIAPVINKADTTWILVSSALVMLMTPGLALFYSGMVRKKNILGTLMQSFASLGIVTIVWVLWGYSLAFAPDLGGFGIIGGFDWVGLKGVGLTPYDYAPTIPHQAFMIFQMMFAIITPALISGALAERFKFSTYIVFLTLWLTLVYAPLAHWVWGGGWIATKLGALDFAGGLVVHISSGVSALVATMIIGNRKNYGKIPMPPHNLILTLLGVALLWFGWFGFNGGSALGANEIAVSAFVVTHIASAAAAIMWVIVEWIHRGKPTVLGIASGAVAGLVAITPAAGFVNPLASILIGLVAGALCYGFVSIVKPKFGYDDSLDAFGVHGVGGIWGAIATGLFATTIVNPNGANGLFYGNASLLYAQVLSIIAAIVYSFVLTFIILKVLDATMGLRITEYEEIQGLDLSQHGEKVYKI